MSYATVPQHLVCMNLTPTAWEDLFRSVPVSGSVPSGHLVYDKSRECYFPVVDEAFRQVWDATSNVGKHVTVACSATMSVCIPENLISDDIIAKSMDILEYRDLDETSKCRWAEVRVHMPKA